jgi:membrane-anchored protein YejM (alkaline phosphatase superfamily)
VTHDAWIWVVAALQILAAVVIAAFWLTWFRQPHEEPWLPAGYVEHERVFVFPDTILALLLVTSAVLLVMEEPLGRSLALVAAGMLTFLGVIDLAYFVQHGMFAREREGLGNLGIVVGVLLLAAILIWRYA